MLPRRISNSAVQTHCPTNVKHFEFWSVTYWTPAFLVVRWPEVMAEQTAHVYILLHILVRPNTHIEVSVPDLDGAILTACGYQLPVAAVGAACGHYLLPLEGAWLEHRFVLLLWLHVPRAYRAVNREKIKGQPREIFSQAKILYRLHKQGNWTGNKSYQYSFGYTWRRYRNYHGGSSLFRSLKSGLPHSLNFKVEWMMIWE